MVQQQKMEKKILNHTFKNFKEMFVKQKRNDH